MGDAVHGIRKEITSELRKGTPFTNDSAERLKFLLDLWCVKFDMSVWSRGPLFSKRKEKPMILIAQDQSDKKAYAIMRAQAMKDYERDLFRYVEKGRVDTTRRILNMKSNVFISRPDIENPQQRITLFDVVDTENFPQMHALLKEEAEKTKYMWLQRALQNEDKDMIDALFAYDKCLFWDSVAGKTVLEMADEQPVSDAFKEYVYKVQKDASMLFFTKGLYQMKSVSFDTHAYRISECVPNAMDAIVDTTRNLLVPARLMRRALKAPRNVSKSNRAARVIRHCFAKRWSKQKH